MEQNQSSFLNYSLNYFGGVLSKSMLNQQNHFSSSPTSILDTKQFCKKPIFGYHKNNPYDQSKGIGLALEDQDFDSFSSPKSKNIVLFGTNLKKVQIPDISLNAEITHNEPSIPSFSSTTTISDSINLKPPCIGLGLEDQEFDRFSSPKSKNMVIFGENLKKIQIQDISSHAEITHDEQSIMSFSTTTTTKSDLINLKSVCLRELGLSLNEMELLEEYTCVIKHGNDRKITHIFDDMIVESCCGEGIRNLCDLKNEVDFKTKGNIVTSRPLVFLEICYNCKIKLDEDKDVYIYRGEKSFCGPECRLEEMTMDEEDEYKF